MSRARAGGIAVLAVAGLLLVVLAVQVGHLPQPVWPTPEPAAAPTAAPTVEPAAQRRLGSALDVLQGWDVRRASAWATGSPTRLARLYAPGSGAGAADVRLLAAYRSRGLHVTGMRTQLLALEVLRADRGRWVLRVEDRLAHAVAVGDGRRRELPRDAASAHVVTLLRAADGRWRVSSVVDG